MSLLSWDSVLQQGFLVPFQSTFSSPSLLHSIYMTLKLFLLLVDFLRAWNLLCSSFKSNSLWVRQSWRRVAVTFWFVLWVQDMFVTGDVLLAPCYIMSSRAVLAAGLSMQTQQHLARPVLTSFTCQKQFGNHRVVCRTPLGQRRRVSMQTWMADACASDQYEVSRRKKTPTSVLQFSRVVFLFIHLVGLKEIVFLI